MHIPRDRCSLSHVAYKLASADATLLFAGMSRSRRVGLGIEYVSTREYSLGDDTRRIDWITTARSIDISGDYKLMVKEFEEEQLVETLIFLNIGYSMGFWDKLGVGVYSSSIALFTATTRNDRVSFTLSPSTVGEENIEFIRSNDPRNLIAAIPSKVCSSKFSRRGGLRGLVKQLPRLRRLRGILVISDYSHEFSEFRELVSVAKSLGKSIGVVFIVNRYEVSPPAEAANSLIKIEGSETVVETPLLDYIEILKRHIRDIRALLSSSIVPFIELYGLTHARRQAHRIAMIYDSVRRKTVVAQYIRGKE